LGLKNEPFCAAPRVLELRWQAERDTALDDADGDQDEDGFSAAIGTRSKAPAPLRSAGVLHTLVRASSRSDLCDVLPLKV